MIKIKEFKKEHLDLLDVTVPQHEVDTVVWGGSIFHDDTIVGTSLFFNKWAKHYECIVFRSNDLKTMDLKIQIGTAKASLKVLNIFIEKFNPMRIQANCRKGFKDGKRYVEFLGFHAEGILKKFGFDGSHYIRYARVF